MSLTAAVVAATGELPKVSDDDVTLTIETPEPEFFESPEAELDPFDELLADRKVIAQAQTRKAALEQERTLPKRVSRSTPRKAPPRPAPAASKAAALLATSRLYFGIPYRWGGKNPSTGLDCSGYTKIVYGRHGIVLPHGSRAQARKGVAVRASEARPGDLLFVKNALGIVHHVAIYAGDGYMHDAPRTGLTVGRRRVWSKPSRTLYRRVL